MITEIEFNRTQSYDQWPILLHSAIERNRMLKKLWIRLHSISEWIKLFNHSMDSMESHVPFRLIDHAGVSKILNKMYAVEIVCFQSTFLSVVIQRNVVPISISTIFPPECSKKLFISNRNIYRKQFRILSSLPRRAISAAQDYKHDRSKSLAVRNVSYAVGKLHSVSVNWVMKT